MQYDKSIDRIRGVLVLIMVYAHVLQFFGNAGTYPAVEVISQVINVLVFPTFVFCFGRSAAIAYLKKPWKAAAPRLIKTTLTMYFVFVLSGLGFRILREGAAFNILTVEKVMTLSDMPGWSEFLAGFAAFALVALVLFKPLQALSTRFVPTLIASAVCLLFCFFPYEVIQSTQAGLFIGTRTFACFPVVQYAPYLLLGIYWQATGKHGRILSGIGLAASFAGVVYTVLNGLPERFPPSLPWVLLTGFFPVIMSFCMAKVPDLRSVPGRIDGWLCNTGRKSLFYLLASNLTIFTLAGMHAAPMVSKRNDWFWKLPIASPFGAFVWTAILFFAIAFVASLAGRSSSKLPQESNNTAAAS